MFTPSSSKGYREVLPGIRLKTLCYDEKTHMVQFVLQGGCDLPMHSHPHEQTGYVVSGLMILTIDGTPHEAHPGDSWCIPANIPHGAKIIEDTVAVEVFSPVREDYLGNGRS